MAQILKIEPRALLERISGMPNDRLATATEAIEMLNALDDQIDLIVEFGGENSHLMELLRARLALKKFIEVDIWIAH